MPRRDGSPTEQEVGAQRAGQGGRAPHRGGGLPPHEAAVAALRATAAAARTAHSAPPVIAPTVTLAAINAAAAGILGAFGQFLDTRRQDQQSYVLELLEQEVPDLPEDQRLLVLSGEMDAEKAFATKARQRLDRDLPKALSIEDKTIREAQVQKILDRERHIAEMRESAMATRTLGAAEQRRAEVLSPEGGFWRLSPHVREHTLDCLAMGNKVWPHSVLRTYHPPLHGGCPCEVWTIQEAEQAGLLNSPAQYSTPDQALQAMQVMESEFDAEEFADELEVLETRARWWRGTAGPGQFRSLRGDVARGLRKPRGPHSGHPVDAEPIRPVDAELDLRDIKADELAEGDRVVIGGEFDTVKVVLAPGVVELESGGLVRLLRPNVLAVKALSAPAPESLPTIAEPAPEVAPGEGEPSAAVSDEEVPEAPVADGETAAPVADATGELEPVVEATDRRLLFDDVVRLVGIAAPTERGELAPGFFFDPESPSTRTQTDPAGIVRVSEAFFRQPRKAREGVVLRQLGYRLARFLGTESIDALALYDVSLNSEKAIAEAYTKLNRPGDMWSLDDPPHELRLIAEAAFTAELPLHPLAEPLADGPSFTEKELTQMRAELDAGAS